MSFRRNFTVVLLISLATVPGAYAINQIGILGGLAVTGLSADSGTTPNLYSNSAKPSFKIGVAAEYDIVPNLISVELNVLYAQYKWEQTLSSAPSNTLAVDYSTNWWEVPLFINYTGIEMFKFGLGPVFDFATGQINSQNSDGTNPLTASYATDFLNQTSLGLGFQAGFSYPFQSPWIVNADLRYVQGLSNLYSGTGPTSEKIHSFDVLVGVGYAF